MNCIVRRVEEALRYLAARGTYPKTFRLKHNRMLEMHMRITAYARYPHYFDKGIYIHQTLLIPMEME